MRVRVELTTCLQTKGILVSGTDSGGNSTTEQIWALILATARHIATEDAGIKACRQLWQSTIPVGLQGKTLGLVGVGGLGQKTAKVSDKSPGAPAASLIQRQVQIAQAFGMKVIGWSPNLTSERAEAAGVGFAKTKAELFQSSDIVSIHMVLSERSQRMITAQDLALMKPTAIFINTSRGPLVDEDALVEMLSKKKIAAAGLDVFDLEPLPLDHPLRGLDNVTLSPHVGYVSDDNYKVRSLTQKTRPNNKNIDGHTFAGFLVTNG